MLRWEKFSLLEKQQIEALLWLNVKGDPKRDIREHQSFLSTVGFDCSREYIRKIFVRWRWSWKVPEYQQIDKYTLTNQRYYVNYLSWLYSFRGNWRNIKFTDEVSFENRGNINPVLSLTSSLSLEKMGVIIILSLFHFLLDVARRRALGPAGQAVIQPRVGNFGTTYTAMTLISLDPTKPVFVRASVETNNQFKFLHFVLRAIRDEYLSFGDILVLDNSRIHTGQEMFEVLMELLEENGIQIMFLPTYSPELNPIELVFGKVKQHLRDHRDDRYPFWYNICIGFSLITQDLIFKYYNKCICQT